MKAFLKKVLVLILTAEARLLLWKYKPGIIAVTGSVGKTTTKDAIYAATQTHLRVRKSEKSYNSEIGVPLTVIGRESAWGDAWGWLMNILYGLEWLVTKKAYPEWLVVEVGADRPGDIRRVAAWLKPDIVVVTGIPAVPPHVEFFVSTDHVAREKRSLVNHMKRNGRVIVNGDDERTLAIHHEYRGISHTFGFGEKNEFRASGAEIVYENGKPIGMQSRLEMNGSSIPVVMRGALGKPRIYAGLAALAVAKLLNVDMVTAAASLAKWEPPPGRMRILPGKNNSIVIDDTYNSSPDAVQSALETVKSIRGARKRVAVLGDMLELGRHSAEAHRKVGEKAAKSAGELITVGLRARGIAAAAKDKKMKEEKVFIYQQGEAERAGRELAPKLKSGHIVLVKGSQAMRMEKTVKELLADESRAAELLIRQEPEWQASA